MAAVNEKKDRALEGIWLAIRRPEKSEDLACSLCHTQIPECQLYNERMWGEPVVVCQTCVTNMIEGRLGLLEAGG